tara:strand:- start:495 stop:1496 length:1002 start_codon:yes stop_codon:yes gene_type:complete
MEVFDSVRKYKVTESDSIIFTELTTEEKTSEKNIAERANVSKSSFYKSLDYFEKLGFSIESKEKKGIKITKKEPRLTPPEFLNYCPERFRKNYHYFTTINSTHDYSMRLIKSKEKVEDSLVVSEYQSSGRGRTGRRWVSKLASGILVSLVLDLSDIKNEDFSMLPIVLSLSVAKAIKSKLSWPNDIMLDDKKVGGTLVNTLIKGDSKYAILSLGLNVFGKNDKTPVALSESTTMEKEGLLEKGWGNPRAVILKRWLKTLEEELTNISNRNTIFKEWNDLLIDKDKEIFWIDSNGKKFYGKFLSGCENGNALVKNDKGETFEIKAEETPFYSFK